MKLTEIQQDYMILLAAGFTTTDFMVLRNNFQTATLFSHTVALRKKGLLGTGSKNTRIPILVEPDGYETRFDRDLPKISKKEARLIIKNGDWSRIGPRPKRDFNIEPSGHYFGSKWRDPRPYAEDRVWLSTNLKFFRAVALAATA